MPTYRDEAVVLRTHKLGEADRIVTLLSRQRGKVRAVAKGVRRVSSRFGGRLEPFSHVDLLLAEGRSLDIVTQAQTLHPFGDLLVGDYERFTAGEVILETADRLVAEEGQPAAAQYRLLVGALAALGRAVPGSDAPGGGLILDSYLLRALAIAGYAPVLDGCARCGDRAQRMFFSPAAGGVVCASCRPPGSVPVDETLTRHLGALLTGDWATATGSEPAVQRRAAGMVAAFAQWHLERGLRSLPLVQRSFRRS